MTQGIFKYFFFILLFVNSAIKAENQVVKAEFELKYSYILDSTHSLNIEQVSKKMFSKESKEVINLGFTKYPCWVKITVNGSLQADSLWKLKVSYPILDSVWFYRLDERGNWTESRTGELVKTKKFIANDRTFTFDINLHKAQTQTFYLKVVTQGSMLIPFKIVRADKEELSYYLVEKMYGAYFGALLVMICFNLAIFIILKDIRFFYYVVFIALQAGIHFIFTGHHLLYLPVAWHPYFNDALLFLMYGTNIFALLFSIKFLTIKSIDKQIYHVLIGLLCASILVGVLQPMINYRFTAFSVALLYLFTPSSLLMAGIIAWRNGQVYARYFVISWGLFVVAVMLLSMRTFGLLDGKYPLETMVQIGSIVDVILLGFALAERYNSFEFEKNKMLVENLKYSLQIEETIREQNKILEHSISERTSELENTKKMVEKQNDKLKEYNINLENEVVQRTEDLTKLIDHLQEHIESFEQYSYIVSHNLRAPVARILGLISLINKKTIGKSNQEIIRHLDISAQNLDDIVKDMNLILDTKNGKGVLYEYIDLNELIKEFRTQNENFLLETSTIIITDFEQITSLYSVKFYMRSILYNLISNAIKYKHPERNPEIAVLAELKDGFIELQISDNGLGFDLDKYAKKVFGLYQRFNIEKEGRGLGLFMVKSQIEFLNGTIELKSEQGRGSNFLIKLPIQISQENTVTMVGDTLTDKIG